MKNLFYVIIFLLIISCTTNKGVYWCGDHPCINEKEKKAYFRNTMTVEIKELKKETLKNNSEIEKIIEHARIEEKRRIKEEKDSAKQAKLEEKRRMKEEKDLARQAKLEEKRRIKEEKDLAKQAKLEKKRMIKEEKDLARQVEQDEKKIIKKKKITSKQSIDIDTKIENVVIDKSNFKKLAEKIFKRNSLRSYPNINDMPN